MIKKFNNPQILKKPDGTLILTYIGDLGELGVVGEEASSPLPAASLRKYFDPTDVSKASRLTSLIIWDTGGNCFESSWAAAVSYYHKKTNCH